MFVLQNILPQVRAMYELTLMIVSDSSEFESKTEKNLFSNIWQIL